MNILKGTISGFVLVVFCFVSVYVNAAPKSKMIDFWNDFEPTSGLKVNHSAWDGLLKKYVNDSHPSGVNRFDYDGVTVADKVLLGDYLAYLQSMDPRQLNRPRQKAFWMNLYNASSVWIVLDSGTKKNIRSVGGIWTKKRFTITRQPMSLNDVEHGVIRPLYSDPRIHFSLTPATIGSGDILRQAFTGDNVEELLERNTKKFFNHAYKGVSVNGSTMVMSSIMKWYKSDFGGDQKGVRSFINKYVSSEKSNLINQTNRVSYQYDWSFNKP